MSTQPSDSSPVSTSSSASIPANSMPANSDASVSHGASDTGVITPVSKSSKPLLIGLLRQLWTLVFRLGVLTVGSGAALAAGIAIATIQPADVDSPPLLEKLLQQADSWNIRP